AAEHRRHGRPVAAAVDRTAAVADEVAAADRAEGVVRFAGNRGGALIAAVVTTMQEPGPRVRGGSADRAQAHQGEKKQLFHAVGPFLEAEHSAGSNVLLATARPISCGTLPRRPGRASAGAGFRGENRRAGKARYADAARLLRRAGFATGS